MKTRLTTKTVKDQKTTRPASVLRPGTSQVRVPRRPTPPSLIFSAAAWLKLQYLCHKGDTEVGAFGVSPVGSPLCVADLAVIRQRCSSVSVEFDDEAVADYFDEQVETGCHPEQFARIWVHTHPGDSPEPSGIDEETFDRVFGRCDWAIMFILARGGHTYCRLRVTARQGCPQTVDSCQPISMSMTIPVAVDYESLAAPELQLPFDLWLDEYESAVTIEPEPWRGLLDPRRQLDHDSPGDTTDEPLTADALIENFEELDPSEQKLVFDEFADAFEWPVDDNDIEEVLDED